MLCHATHTNGTEILRSAQGSLAHKFERLTRVHAFDEGDFLCARNDRICDLVQQCPDELHLEEARRLRRPLTQAIRPEFLLQDA